MSDLGVKRIRAIERNGRRLVEIMVRCFPVGATTEVLREHFERETGVKRQTFYSALSWVKVKRWVVGGGEYGVPNNLNSDKCWMAAVQESLQKKHLYNLYRGKWNGLENSDWSNFGADRNQPQSFVDPSKMTDFEKEMWEDLQKGQKTKC
jgi:hypothetical protein